VGEDDVARGVEALEHVDPFEPQGAAAGHHDPLDAAREGQVAQVDVGLPLALAESLPTMRP
jgi:hypothetical protein